MITADIEIERIITGIYARAHVEIENPLESDYTRADTLLGAVYNYWSPEIPKLSSRNCFNRLNFKASARAMC